MKLLRSLSKPRILIPLVIAAALIVALLSFFDVRKTLTILAGFQRRYLLYFFLLMVAYEVARAAQWSYMIARLEVKAPRRSQIFAFALSEVTKVLPIGNYFQNYVLKQSRGADIGRTSAATTLIIIEEVIVSLIGVVSLGLGAWTTEVRIVALGGGLVVAVAAWALVRFNRGASRPEWISRRPSLNRMADELARFREGAVALMNPRSLAITLAYSTAYLILGGAALYAVVRGLGISHATFTESLAVYFFSLALGLIIPLPVDIGIIELSGLGAFLAIGVERNAALSAILANRLLSILASLVIAALVIAVLRGEAATLLKRTGGRRPRRHRDPEEEGGDSDDHKTSRDGSSTVSDATGRPEQRLNSGVTGA